MKYSIKWLDIAYEAKFLRPEVTLAASPQNVLHALVQTVGGRYVIQSNDLRVSASSVVGEVRVSAELFNGNGVIEISADRLVATFKNVRGKPDTDIVEDCISLAIEALSTFVPKDHIAQENIRVSGWLALDRSDAENWTLDQFITNNLFRSIGGSSTRSQSLGLKLDTRDSSEKWQTAMDIAPAWEESNTLFVSCSTFFQQGGKFAELREKSRLVTDEMTFFLRSLGLFAADSN